MCRFASTTMYVLGLKAPNILLTGAELGPSGAAQSYSEWSLDTRWYHEIW